MHTTIILFFWVICVCYWLYVIKNNNEYKHVVFGFEVRKIHEWNNGSHWLVEYNYDGFRGIMVRDSFVECFKKL